MNGYICHEELQKEFNELFRFNLPYDKSYIKINEIKAVENATDNICGDHMSNTSCLITVKYAAKYRPYINLDYLYN